MTKKRIALLILITMLFNLMQITVFATDTSAVKEYNGGTATLELSGTHSASGCDAAIYAHDGANLTIEGNGNVHGILCKEAHDASNPEKLCGYATAVWANNNTTITITGGNYTNDADTVSNDQSHVDLIYAGNNSNITITGGTFKCATPKWTLNCKDNTSSTITVKGGRFYQFDPSNADVAPEGTTEVIVPEGYRVVQDGEWYEVKKVHTNKVYTNSAMAELELTEDFSASGCDAAIYVNDYSSLIISGTGNVHGMLCAGQSCGNATCGYATAVWANNYGNVTITGGNYTNDADTVSNDQSHVDLIYAGNNSNITITGGTFKCATPKWTLNCKDGTSSTITVKGGRFYQFDPSNADVGEGEIIVEDGYEVFKDGDWYEVILAHQKNTVHEAKAATYTEEGNIYYASCDICGKYFTNKYAVEEITDKNSVIIPKLAEVTNNNATVTENAFDTAIKDAADSTTVVIPVVETEETVKSVTVPVNSLKDVATENKELSIETSEVTTTMDKKALDEIVEQAGNNPNIQIEIIKVEDKVLNEKQKAALKNKEVFDIISAKILANGKEISDFGGGKVKLEIPFTPEKNTKGTDYKVVYIADDGKTTDVPTKYIDGMIVVELKHFSEYAIVKVAANNQATNTPATNNPNAGSAPAVSAPAATTTTSNPATGDGIVVYFIALAIAIAGICGIVIIKAKRK